MLSCIGTFYYKFFNLSRREIKWNHASSAAEGFLRDSPRTLSSYINKLNWGELGEKSRVTPKGGVSPPKKVAAVDEKIT